MYIFLFIFILLLPVIIPIIAYQLFIKKKEKFSTKVWLILLMVLAGFVPIVLYLIAFIITY